jgi:general secretion pathway protein E
VAGRSQEARRLLNRAHGVIFVTGPTGSGKSTSLYAYLNRINSAEKNVITIEDPIEYQLEGISQIQVASKKGMTFATSLRHVLRQDPDVIMVGEVRDVETARMAIQSSLTGHLVFSTLHTNDAAGAVSRLLDLGVEPYLVSSSLIAIMAQRLVRKDLSGLQDSRRSRRPRSSTSSAWGARGQQGARILRRGGLRAVLQDRLSRPNRDL